MKKKLPVATAAQSMSPLAPFAPRPPVNGNSFGGKPQGNSQRNVTGTVHGKE